MSAQRHILTVQMCCVIVTRDGYIWCEIQDRHTIIPLPGGKKVNCSQILFT